MRSCLWTEERDYTGSRSQATTFITPQYQSQYLSIKFFLKLLLIKRRKKGGGGSRLFTGWVAHNRSVSIKATSKHGSGLMASGLNP